MGFAKCLCLTLRKPPDEIARKKELQEKVRDTYVLLATGIKRKLPHQELDSHYFPLQMQLYVFGKEVDDLPLFYPYVEFPFHVKPHTDISIFFPPFEFFGGKIPP